MNNNIDWIVFDLGNVVYDLSRDALLDAVIHASNKSPAEIQALFSDSFHLGAEELSLNERFQLGLLSEEDYFNELHVALDKQVSVAQLKAAWLSMLVAENPETLAIIQSLYGKMHLGCLSNTHAQHWQYLLDTSQAFKYFDVKVASHLVGAAKPDPAIYRAFCEQANTEPSRCLLIDDLPQNVAGAMSCGWQAVLFDRSKPLKALLAAIEPLKPHLVL